MLQTDTRWMNHCKVSITPASRLSPPFMGDYGTFALVILASLPLAFPLPISLIIILAPLTPSLLPFRCLITLTLCHSLHFQIVRTLPLPVSSFTLFLLLPSPLDRRLAPGPWGNMEAMKPEPIIPADEHGIVLNFIINYTVMHHLFLLGCRRLGSCFTVTAISSLQETRGKEEAHDKLLNLRQEVWGKRLEQRCGGNGCAIWFYCICISPGHEEDVREWILYFLWMNNRFCYL